MSTGTDTGSAPLAPATGFGASLPRYRRLARDPEGRRHLLVTGPRVGPPPAAAGLDDAERIVTDDAPGGEARALEALARLLAEARMGLRLYVRGDEAFLWLAAMVAAAAGLGEGEIELEIAGDKRVPVHCMACGAGFAVHPLDDVGPAFAECPGCGANLRIRCHFSRRLGAYQGIPLP